MKARERIRKKLLDYLGDPEKEFPPWVYLCTEICGYKNPRQLFQLFTVEQRQQIEREALEIRRKRYGRYIAQADMALFKKAKTGDPAAIKLIYQRHEDWAEKRKEEVSGEEGGPLEIVFLPAKEKVKE